MKLSKLPLFDDSQHWLIEANDEKEHWKEFAADDEKELKREIYEFFVDCDFQNLGIDGIDRKAARDKAVELSKGVEF